MFNPPLNRIRRGSDSDDEYETDVDEYGDLVDRYGYLYQFLENDKEANLSQWRQVCKQWGIGVSNYYNNSYYPDFHAYLTQVETISSLPASDGFDEFFETPTGNSIYFSVTRHLHFDVEARRVPIRIEDLDRLFPSGRNPFFGSKLSIHFNFDRLGDYNPEAISEKIFVVLESMRKWGEQVSTLQVWGRIGGCQHFQDQLRLVVWRALVELFHILPNLKNLELLVSGLEFSNSKEL